MPKTNGAGMFPLKNPFLNRHEKTSEKCTDVCHRKRIFPKIREWRKFRIFYSRVFAQEFLLSLPDPEALGAARKVFAQEFLPKTR